MGSYFLAAGYGGGGCMMSHRRLCGYNDSLFFSLSFKLFLESNFNVEIKSNFNFKMEAEQRRTGKKPTMKITEFDDQVQLVE
jgi:hypothetical protein